jgi:hypothetical protein
MADNAAHIAHPSPRRATAQLDTTTHLAADQPPATIPFVKLEALALGFAGQPLEWEGDTSRSYSKAIAIALYLGLTK